MSKFQIVILGIFVIFIVAGIVAFATYKGSSANSTLPTISVWGTFPADIFDQYVSGINSSNANQANIKYVQISQGQFTQTLISALAKGQGPDAILVPADMILSNIDKIVTIPYTAMTQRDFINTYINEASIYLNSNGILALPFTVDPLVMYWNRDTFSAAGIATYPHYWSDFTSLNQSLTSKDQNGNVRKSAVAMGTFSNISHARELFGTLLMQIGNPVTTISGGKVVTTVSTGNNAIDPAAVLKFFSQFADPTNSNYCWNQGMLNDKAEFLSGELATYFGFASELQDLRTKNPNINFDVAPVPQIKTGGVKATYGQLYGFSILRSSSNANAAYQVLSMILGPQSISNLAQTMYLPSVRIDAMNNIASDPYLTIFNQAALISKTWMDVDPVQSNQILGNMVNYYTSGQKTATDAIQFTEGQYNLLLNGASQ